jgi:hypothetical protein
MMKRKRRAMTVECIRALFVVIGVTFLLMGMLSIIVGASEAGVLPRHFHLVHPWTHGCTNVEEAALLVTFGTAALWSGICLIWLRSLDIRLTELGQYPKLDYVSLSKITCKPTDRWILE